MSFEGLLIQAQAGSETALDELLAHYRPLLSKNPFATAFSTKIFTRSCASPS